jgi:hypothetical protein
VITFPNVRSRSSSPKRTDRHAKPTKARSHSRPFKRPSPSSDRTRSRSREKVLKGERKRELNPDSELPEESRACVVNTKLAIAAGSVSLKQEKSKGTSTTVKAKTAAANLLSMSGRSFAFCCYLIVCIIDFFNIFLEIISTLIKR